MPHRVFLSHARANEAEARWLRGRLNRYRIPDHHLGVASPADRLDVVLGELAGAYDDAALARMDSQLADSEALIVLCSPETAADPLVNRAIDTFVALGRLRRIFPVIAARAPEALDFERDFFPPALAGRGLLAADFREFQRGDAVVGDGLEGGLLKLLSAMSGVEIQRLAQLERKQLSIRILALSIAAAALAVTTVAAGAYGFWAQRNAMAIDAQRQVAVRNALQAAQSRDEALAASEAQSEQQARAETRMQRARERLAESIRNLSTMTNQRLEQIAAAGAATPENLEAMRSIEGVYWNLAEASPQLELRPGPIGAVIERLASTYRQIGRTEDAQRVTTRFARLNQRIASAADADPAWRNSYASALLELAGRRGAAADAAGQISALAQAAQIVEPICVDAPDPNAPAARAELRANACMRFATIALSRTAAQEASALTVDAASLERARLLLEASMGAYPDNRRLQTNGARLKQQIDRALTRLAAPREAAATPEAAP